MAYSLRIFNYASPQAFVFVCWFEKCFIWIRIRSSEAPGGGTQQRWLMSRFIYFPILINANRKFLFNRNYWYPGDFVQLCICEKWARAIWGNDLYSEFTNLNLNSSIFFNDTINNKIENWENFWKIFQEIEGFILNNFSWIYIENRYINKIKFLKYKYFIDNVTFI